MVLDKTDFEKASPEKTKHIEIKHFVDEAEIDSMYFEQPYYLQPDKTGARAYALLRDAFRKTGKAGIALFVMRDREHLCTIKAKDDVLVLIRIRFAEEIRETKDLDLPATKSKPDELKMAVSLIKQLSGPFDISKYRDDYTERLLKVIKAKAKGKAVPFTPMKVVHSRTKDLAEQLRASLSEKKKAS